MSPLTKVPLVHAWPDNPRAAVDLQNRLRDQVLRTDQLGLVQHVAGLDVGFEAHNTIVRAAVVVLSFPDLQLVDQALARRPVSFPYVPGLLSFREAPTLLDALQQLTITPDLLLCDGQGLTHPRRLGIACHLGILTGIPAIGVAKSILVGKHDSLPPTRGVWRPLIHREEIVGAALRTRERVSPVYVSLGHRISLESAIHYVMACTTRYRLPETTRHAHRLASG